MISPHKPEDYQHTSVLLSESIDVLQPNPGGIFIDCTLGGGGHTERLLKSIGPSGKVLAFDRDPVAIENASKRFADALSKGRLVLINSPFSEIFSFIQKSALLGKVDGILADIGVSSHHLDEPTRGFSFMNDGPLDMRMNQRTGQSAADFVASATEEQLADCIFKFGEEPKARFIAKLICERRAKQPFTTTKSLADLIAAKVRWKTESRKHPATKTFQALRIVVNRELEELESLLHEGYRVLKVGGTLAIITFHSLEDRLVKTSMLRLAGKSPSDQLPRDLVLTVSQLASQSKACAEIVTPFPIKPSDDEISYNPRARSAKLRAIRLIK